MLFKTFIRKQLRLKAHTVTEIEPSDEQMVVQIERLGAKSMKPGGLGGHGGISCSTTC